jgi:hypothetical protein
MEKQRNQFLGPKSAGGRDKYLREAASQPNYAASRYYPGMEKFCYLKDSEETNSVGNVLCVTLVILITV